MPDFITLFLGILLLLLILLSIVGNILVCIAVATEKQLRKLSNLFLVSLAIADLLVAAFVMPFALLNDLGSWKLGEFFCKIWISSDVMCSTASIVNLCAISLDRFIHIKDPLQYTELITRRSVPITIGVIWVTSALISFLPISLNWHTSFEEEIANSMNNTGNYSGNYNATTFPDLEEARSMMLQLPVDEEGNEHCALNFNPSYSIISSFISFFIPCFIMLFIYFHVYNFARYHMKSIKEQNRPLLRLRKLSIDNRCPSEEINLTHPQQQLALVQQPAVIQQQQQQPDLTNGTQSASSKQRENGRQKKKKRKKSKLMDSDSPLIQEHKAAITIGIIMGVFLLCWTPFFIVNVVSGICKECIPGTLFSVLSWLGYSNSAFNPIIYSIFNVEFREAFHRILTHRPLCRKKAEFPFDV